MPQFNRSRVSKKEKFTGLNYAADGASSSHLDFKHLLEKGFKKKRFHFMFCFFWKALLYNY